MTKDRGLLAELEREALKAEDGDSSQYKTRTYARRRLKNLKQDVVMSYLTAQPAMSLQWAARFYDEDDAVIRQYATAVQDRALAERAGTEGDTDTTERYPVEPPDPDVVDDSEGET